MEGHPPEGGLQQPPVNRQSAREENEAAKNTAVVRSTRTTTRCMSRAVRSIPRRPQQFPVIRKGRHRNGRVLLSAQGSWDGGRRWQEVLPRRLHTKQPLSVKDGRVLLGAQEGRQTGWMSGTGGAPTKAATSIRPTVRRGGGQHQGLLSPAYRGRRGDIPKSKNRSKNRSSGGRSVRGIEPAVVGDGNARCAGAGRQRRGGPFSRPGRAILEQVQ